MTIKKGDEFTRIATLKVIEYDAKTEVATCLNDRGAVVILLKSQIDSIYRERYESISV